MNIQAFLQRLDNRQFYMLLGGAVLLLVAAAVSVVLIPQYKGYRAALAARAGLPPMPADSEILRSLLTERDAAIEARSRQLHGDMANLPVREIEAFVIDRLQGIAWNHDVVLQGVRPSAGDTIETFREILFNLELSGQYADLFAWLHELRDELGFIVIKEYQMDRVSNVTDDPMLKVQLTIASYRKEGG